jgi:hypothetical protein
MKHKTNGSWFVVSKNDDRWEFRPSLASVRLDVVVGVILGLSLTLFSIPFVWIAVVPNPPQFVIRFMSPDFGWFMSPDFGWNQPPDLLIRCLALVGGVGLLSFSWLCFVMAKWGWQLRRAPLIVEQDGRVRYGKQILCESETARSVRVVREVLVEDCIYKVCIAVAGEQLVELPTFFKGSQNHDEARSFASVLARVLKVSMHDQ